MIDRQALKMLLEDENKLRKAPLEAGKIFGNVNFAYTKARPALHNYMQRNAEYYGIPLESTEKLDSDKLASFLNDVVARLRFSMTIKEA